MYFLLVCSYSLSVAYHTNLEIEMKANMNLNMRLLASVQYYSIESAIDSSDFEGKRSTRQQLGKIIASTYEEQRVMYAGAEDETTDQELG